MRYISGWNCRSYRSIKIERNGAFVSIDKLRAQSHEIAIRLAELESQACELAGQPFNLASPKQLGEILFEKLELPVIKKTPKVRPQRRKRSWSNWRMTTSYRQCSLSIEVSRS